MKKILCSAAASALIALFFTFSTTTAYAESGNRLCGLAKSAVKATTKKGKDKPGMALVVKVKRAKNKPQRKALNKACDQIYNKMIDALKQKKISTSNFEKVHRWTCEQVSNKMSNNENGEDICKTIAHERGKNHAGYMIEYSPKTNKFRGKKL
jgi:hypothetical protein